MVLSCYISILACRWLHHKLYDNVFFILEIAKYAFFLPDPVDFLSIPSCLSIHGIYEIEPSGSGVDNAIGSDLAVHGSSQALNYPS